MRHFSASPIEMFASLWRNRELIKASAKREGGKIVGFQKWIVRPKGFNATSFGTPSVVVGSNCSSQPTVYDGG